MSVKIGRGPTVLVADITKFDVRAGTPVALVGGSWATIYSESGLQKLTKIKAIKITVTGTSTGLAYRIRAAKPGQALTKIFPYGASKSFQSGREYVIVEMVSVPRGWNFDVQVYCTAADGGTAILTALKVIEVGVTESI